MSVVWHRYIDIIGIASQIFLKISGRQINHEKVLKIVL